MLAAFWLLYTINSSFPHLNHFFQAKKGHPERIFRAMLGLGGAHTFSTEESIRDYRATITKTSRRVSQNWTTPFGCWLETGWRSNFVALPLKLVQPSILRHRAR